MVAPIPSRSVERELWDSGYDLVVGLDEVGRGAWAGPLTVGAAVLPPDRRVYGVRDSKALSEVVREALYDKVARWCSAWATGHASPAECDALGMSDAQRLAASRALEALGVQPDYVVIDGNWDFVNSPGSPHRAPVRTIIKGDSTCLAIAAASVLAKVTRDRIMRADADSFPAYEFASNKGYPCPRHKKALAGWGPTSIHRLSWSFMDGIPWASGPR